MTGGLDTLTANVVQGWGERGRAWLDDLDGLVAALSRDWELELGPAYPLSFHWVAPARRAEGTPAVLKVGVPDGHLAQEAAALRAWDGRGAVALLDQDPARGAVLLERAEPGSTAECLVADEPATAVVVDLLRELHATPDRPAGLPHVRTEGAAFTAHLTRYPGDDPLPRAMVARAAALFTELCASGPADVLLHGDLHHANVLSATRRPWLAIDPHGYLGDPGYDTGQLLYNPLSADADRLAALAPRRVEQLADGLGLPLDRTRAWGYVVCVLSEVWSAGDGYPIDGRPLAVARRLEADL